MEWGVQIHRAITAADTSVLAAAGLNRVTVPLPWAWVERRKGQVDFAALDHFLEPLRTAGLPLQGVLGPGMRDRWPAWLHEAGGVDHPDYIQHFASHCALLASRLTGIEVFRVEEDLNAAFWWEGLRTRKRRGRAWRSASFRRRLLLESCAAVRDARPDVEIRITLRPGIPGWEKELRRWLKAGLEFHCLGLTLSSSHVLPDPDLSEAVGEWVGEVGEVLANSGASDRSIEIARIGYPTQPERFTPKRQREFLVGAARAAREAGAVGFHWWSLRDQAHDDPMLGYWTPEAERHMGLLYYDSTPKPAMDEYRVLATGDRFGGGAGR
ncbi:MAG: hypothetical protein VX498_05265 [Myxococcota bacterium]|nr:hypothetical protein [Myxococcota bacterium]